MCRRCARHDQEGISVVCSRNAYVGVDCHRPRVSLSGRGAAVAHSRGADGRVCRLTPGRGKRSAVVAQAGGAGGAAVEGDGAAAALPAAAAAGQVQGDGAEAAAAPAAAAPPAAAAAAEVEAQGDVGKGHGEGRGEGAGTPAGRGGAGGGGARREPGRAGRLDNRSARRARSRNKTLKQKQQNRST